MTEQERLVWLTLVANADHLGVVTRCPVSMIVDYVCCTPRQVRTTIDGLERQMFIKKLPTSGRRLHYRLLGAWENSIAESRNFVEHEGERVRAAQNQRSRVYEKTHAGIRNGPTFHVTDLEKVSPIKIRFSLVIDGLCTIRDCAVITRVDGSTFLSEPAKRFGDKWVKTCTIDPLLAHDAIDAVLHGRTQPIIGSRKLEQIEIFDSAFVDVNGSKCRTKINCSVAIPAVITVYGCAVLEPLTAAAGVRFLAEPAKNLGGVWFKTVEFQSFWAARIVADAVAAVH